VDPASYRGPHWFRYDPAQRKLEILGRINRQWGLLGFVLEPKYQRLYGLAEDGHLFVTAQTSHSLVVLRARDK
jgi:hypothetical protein